MCPNLCWIMERLLLPNEVKVVIILPFTLLGLPQLVLAVVLNSLMSGEDQYDFLICKPLKYILLAL